MGGLTIDDITGHHGTYKLIDINKLRNYLRLSPSMSGLKMHIFIDNSESYKRDRHPLLLFAKNGVKNEYIPFVICEHPYIMDDADDIDYAVDYEDLFSVQDFVQDNLNMIIKLANMEIDNKEFYNKMKQYDKKQDS